MSAIFTKRSTRMFYCQVPTGISLVSRTSQYSPQDVKLLANELYYYLKQIPTVSDF